MILNHDLVMMDDDVVGFPHGWFVLVEGRALEVGSQANDSVSRQNHHGFSMFLRGHEAFSKPL